MNKLETKKPPPLWEEPNVSFGQGREILHILSDDVPIMSAFVRFPIRNNSCTPKKLTLYQEGNKGGGVQKGKFTSDGDNTNVVCRQPRSCSQS